MLKSNVVVLKRANDVKSTKILVLPIYVRG